MNNFRLGVTQTYRSSFIAELPKVDSHPFPHFEPDDTTKWAQNARTMTGMRPSVPGWRNLASW